MNEQNFITALKTSLIDYEIESDSDFQHQLLTNTQKSKIVTTIIDNLLICDEFKIAVGFITNSGVSLLINALAECEKRGISGQILTGEYLSFTDPTALERLTQFKNIEVKLVTEKDLHAKGYFFRTEDKWRMIVGSSNITQAALTTTEEWNIVFTAYESGSVCRKVLNQFTSLWGASLDIKESLPSYKQQYQSKLEEQQLVRTLLAKHRKDTNNQVIEYQPNLMQKQALSELANLRNSGEDRGLIISATGTGKTVLSAFDVKAFAPKRCMFIVHRENIARKSLETYKSVMPKVSMGMYTGNDKQLECDFIFATIQTLANNLEQFKSSDFDYIIIDEVHHGGAKSYQRVFNYFSPKFWLGMTATPQRTDGFNIFEMFDFNIAFEYQLDQALKSELLAPFHYFGVSDVTINDVQIDEKTALSKLVDEQRVNHIIDKIKLYGHSGDTVHGLMFVSNRKEAGLLSQALNNKGLRTLALTGEDNEERRLGAINQLENGKLDYLITVDIFNEGIDIPSVNQIVLLRPTTSAIVYIQQLGRGLRKLEGKEYVVIIDFIANYKNNYLIPVAVAGDHTYDKDVIKKDVIINGNDYLHGASVIQFEEIVKQQLLKQVTYTNFSTVANVKRDYLYLKSKLNRMPTLVDFYTNNLISPTVIVSKDNYLKLVSKIEKVDYSLSVTEELVVDYITHCVFPAKRMHEVFILEKLLETDNIKLEQLINQFEVQYRLGNQTKIIENAVSHLQRTIFTSLSDEKKYIPLINRNDRKLSLSAEMKMACDNELVLNAIKDILKVSKLMYQDSEYDSNKLLTVGQLYNRKQAYKYLLHDYSNGYQVSGSTFFKDQCLIFITLDDSNSFTQYDNQLLDNQTITWFSKANRREFNSKGILTNEGKLANNQIEARLFIKRNSSEQFYYLGTLGQTIKYQAITNSSGKDAIKYWFKLKEPINDKLYKYLTTKN